MTSRDIWTVYVRVRGGYPASFPWWTPAQTVLQNEGEAYEMCLFLTFCLTIASEYERVRKVHTVKIRGVLTEVTWTLSSRRMMMDFKPGCRAASWLTTTWRRSEIKM